MVCSQDVARIVENCLYLLALALLQGLYLVLHLVANHLRWSWIVELNARGLDELSELVVHILSRVKVVCGHLTETAYLVEAYHGAARLVEGNEQFALTTRLGELNGSEARIPKLD